jgi:hypothetical protein
MAMTVLTTVSVAATYNSLQALVEPVLAEILGID